MNVDVKYCARCGKDHDQLEFKKFVQPVFDEQEWDYWATCPTTGDPILMRVVTDSEGVDYQPDEVDEI